MTFSSSSSTASGSLPGASRGAIADAEDMRIDRQWSAGRTRCSSTTLAVLAAGAGQRHQFFARARAPSPPNSSTSFFDSKKTFFALVRLEADGLDQVANAVLAERHHFFRRIGQREQSRGRLVDAGIGRLRRQHHRDQQRERIGVLQARPFGSGSAA